MSPTAIRAFSRTCSPRPARANRYGGDRRGLAAEAARAKPDAAGCGRTPPDMAGPRIAAPVTAAAWEPLPAPAPGGATTPVAANGCVSAYGGNGAGRPEG